jgi:hypothetical protein
MPRRVGRFRETRLTGTQILPGAASGPRRNLGRELVADVLSGNLEDEDHLFIADEDLMALEPGRFEIERQLVRQEPVDARTASGRYWQHYDEQKYVLLVMGVIRQPSAENRTSKLRAERHYPSRLSRAASRPLAA